MKITAFAIILFAGISVAKEIRQMDEIRPKKLKAIELSNEVIQDSSWTHLKGILSTNGILKDGYIQADVTEYAEKVLANVQTLIVRKGLDPMQLSDETIKLIPTGTCTLTNGTLKNLSTVSLYNSVIAKYNQHTGILELTLPLAFKSLSINYNYRTKIVLLSIKGGIEAKINNVKLNVHMGFNFTSYHAFVYKADITDSGSISFKFTGQGIVDWVIDLLTGVLTTLFHGIILSVINIVIDVPIESVVDIINKFIDTILQRDSVSVY